MATWAGASKDLSAVEALGALVAAARQPALLIFDGVADLEDIRPFVDAAGMADVLVTTSTQAAGAMTIGGLPAANDVLRMVQDAAGLAESDAQRLLEGTGGIPFLLLHACSYIAATGCSVDEYAARIAGPTALLQHESFSPLDYREGVRRAVDATISISADEQLISKLLPSLAMLAQAPVPLRVLEFLEPDVEAHLQVLKTRFGVTINREHRTAEIHALLRWHLREHPAPGSEAIRQPLIRALWDVLADDDAEVVVELAPHVLTLCDRPDAAPLGVALGEALAGADHLVAAEQVARKARVCLIDVAEPLTEHERTAATVARANATRSLCWILHRQARDGEARALMYEELAAVNDTGDLAVRGDYLHVLGHAAEHLETRIPDAQPALEAFSGAVNAFRVVEPQGERLAMSLVDVAVVLARRARQQIAEERYEDAESAVQEAEAALEEADRVASARWASKAKPDHVHERRGYVRSDLGLLRTQLTSRRDGEERQPDLETFLRAGRHGSFSGLSGAVAAVVGLFLDSRDHRAALAWAETIVPFAFELDLSEASAEQRVKNARALQASAQEEREAIVSVRGAESDLLALPAFKEVVAHHFLNEGDLAARAADEFVLLAADRLGVAAAAAIANGLASSRTTAEHAHRKFVALCNWLDAAPVFRHALWLRMAATGETIASPSADEVDRVVRELAQHGARGTTVAADGVHGLGHSENFGSDRLQYHELSVALYERAGARSLHHGVALYCLAHILVKERRAEDALRRFTQAREILTSTAGPANALVRHIDAHLRSEDPPYLERDEDPQ
jgi:hypothetical protein